MRNNRNSHSLLVGMQNGVVILEDSLAVSYKTKQVLLSHYLAITRFGIYPKELKTYVHTKKFITALFIIAKTWKQPRCPSVDEWVNKLWYVHIIDYFQQ